MAEVASVPEDAVGALRLAGRGARRRHVLDSDEATGLRGGACAICLEEAERDGADHWLPRENASIWRVTCRRHRERLIGLLGFEWQLGRGGLRLTRGGAGGADGARRRLPPPARTLLVCEAAFERAMSGLPPGRRWRVRAPGRFLACAAELAVPVLWRAGTGGPCFAQRFDDFGRDGRLSTWVGEDPSAAALAGLASEPPRSRAGVVEAVGLLLMRPEAAHVFGGARDIETDDPDPVFGALVRHLGDRQKAALGARAERWPREIAAPAQSALRGHRTVAESPAYSAPPDRIIPRARAANARKTDVLI